MSEESLSWPTELAAPAEPGELIWHDRGSNCVLDVHGDPARARLTLFSDGNHHMALAQTLAAFVRRHPDVGDVLYLTLPPPLLLKMLAAGGVRLGHLRLSLEPDAFIGPRAYMERVGTLRPLGQSLAFARSRGQALLVRRANPKAIRGPADLQRADVRLFISNPERETASFEVYAETLTGAFRARGLDADALQRRLAAGTHGVVHGEHVHHREAPAALAGGRADVAVLYSHLALRYCRVFPDLFEMLELPGAAGTVHTDYFVAARKGSAWGPRLAEFMFDDPAREAYAYHGLDPLPAP